MIIDLILYTDERQCMYSTGKLIFLVQLQLNDSYLFYIVKLTVIDLLWVLFQIELSSVCLCLLLSLFVSNIFTD